MHIALTPEQDSLRAELRDYFKALVTPERRTALATSSGEFGDATVYKEVIRQIGHDGWLGIGWPEEYGGQDRSMMDQLIFTDEAAIAGVPIPYLTLNTVGPTIMRFGSDAQKTEMLPKILKGLSMILVPADAEGFSYTPVHTVAGVGTSATYYEDVRVPKDNLVGELNGGWALMTNQLNHERVALTSAAPVTHSIRLVTDWAQQTRNPDGSRVIDAEWVQVLLGRAHARADMLKLLNWQLASATKDLSPADASATKVYGSEMATEVYRSLMEVVGPKALVTGDSAGTVLRGRLERFYRSSLVMTFGGGTNEIQRDIIGYVGLGLPPAKR